MKSFSIAKGKADIKAAFDQALAIDPSVLFLFAAPEILRDEASWSLIKEKAKGRLMIGCSTAGEIANEGAFEKSFSLLSIHFNKTPVRVVTRPIANVAESFSSGESLGEKLKAQDLRAVFILTPGANVNGSAITEGLRAAVGKEVILSGGMAGDETDFKMTHTLCGGDIYTDHLVAVGFYGDHIVVSCASEGGWRPFGPARKVTRAESNVLYELDGKPALQLYKQYLGERARQLPASGLSYPFAILREDRTMSGLIRLALDIDHANESLIMAGDIKQGARVCLMHADTGALIQGAAQAAAESLRTHKGPEENGCALVVNCVGRRMVLGIDAEEEIEAVTDSFLPGTSIAGYYSYGEISTHMGTGAAELHNQTMTITYITERGEA